MEIPVKRMKITPEIWDYVLEFMTEHPEMATGKFVGPFGKQHITELWNELAEKFNALGGGTKTASKWQKSFSDWKYNIKQKYAGIKTQRSKTGGGPAYHKTLTIQEERLLGLIGISSTEGDSVVEEIGLARQGPIETFDIEAGPSTSGLQLVSPEPPEIIVVSQDSPEPDETLIVPSGTSSPSISRPSSRATGSSDLPRTPAARQVPPRSRHGEGASLERFQAETMGVLNEINEHLSSMAENCKD